MQQKKFKSYLISNVLRFLWRQWSSMGAAGGARQEDD